MIKITDIITAIKGAGFKIAFDSFSTPQALPFLCYTDQGSNDFYADNENYTNSTVYDLELYTSKKSKATENQITGILKGLGIAYSRNPTTFISEENCYSTVYTFELMEE